MVKYRQIQLIRHGRIYEKKTTFMGLYLAGLIYGGLIFGRKKLHLQPVKLSFLSFLQLKAGIPVFFTTCEDVKYVQS